MADTQKIAAEYQGLKVPDSPFLNDTRIERINAGRYEGQEVAGALHLVKEGDRVLEMGAGIGFVGAAASYLRKPAKVVSYEANPALIPHIKALYKINKLGRRNFVRNKVLISAKDRPKTLPFAVHNSFLGSSLGGDVDKAKEVVDVATDDFASVARELDPHVMLIDIEGGELDLLQHADLNAMKSLRGIVIEFHPNAYGIPGMRSCKNVLREAGFIRNDELSTRMVWVAEK